MNKITINPSIAVELDIDSISRVERVEIIFTADASWSGAYEVTIYNSPSKNTSISPMSVLNAVDKVIIWTIEPVSNNIEVGVHYYEIVESQAKRVMFKGKLVIVN